MGFHGEEKILFIQIIMIYTEAIGFVVLIPFVGLGIGSVIMIASIGITLFSIYTYKLWLYRNLREEIGAMRYLTGWLIARSGDWRYVDIGIVNEDEIEISDQELEAYEHEVLFQEVLKNFQETNAEFRQLLNVTEFRDSFVDKDLMKEYTDYGLVSSRQIYAFELLKVILSGTDEYKKVIEELPKIKEIGKKTAYLESLMKKYKVTDKMAYNSLMYGKKLVRLHDVDYIQKDASDVRKYVIKNSIPLILSFIGSVLAIISLIYIKTVLYTDLVIDQIIEPNVEIAVNVIYGLGFVPIILGFIITIFRIRKIQDECQEPYTIQFNNILSKRNAFESYCEVRHRLKEFGSDARIWKIYPFQKYRHYWNSDYIILILPASFEDSFSFKQGAIGHRGYSVEVTTAPIVMLDIGSLFSTIPIYLVIACDYHFKRFTKIFYNYNLLQSWKEKIYLHLISTIQTKLSLLEPEKRTLGIRADQWKEFAIVQSQLFQADKYTQKQELIKNRIPNQRMPTPPSENGEEEGDDDDGEEQQNGSKKKGIIITIVVIIVILLILFTIFFIYNNMNTLQELPVE